MLTIVSENMKSEVSKLVDYGFHGKPHFSERLSGDSAIVGISGDVIFAAIIDGLGHGPEAHDVALKAEEFLRVAWSVDLRETMSGLHNALKGTRGAAAGLMVLNATSGLVQYLGVGNTVFRKFGSHPCRLLSTPGIVGYQYAGALIQNSLLEASGVILLYTDGVSDHFEQTDYAQLTYETAQVVSRKVVRRFGKDYDDATCITLRYKT